MKRAFNSSLVEPRGPRLPPQSQMRPGMAGLLLSAQRELIGSSLTHSNRVRWYVPITTCWLKWGRDKKLSCLEVAAGDEATEVRGAATTKVGFRRTRAALGF